MGTLFLTAVLRIRDVHLGTDFSSPDPGPKRSRIRIHIKEFKYFFPKKLFLSSPDLNFLPIPDPRSRGLLRHWIPDPDPQHCLTSLHKIISWVNHVGRIFWVAIPTLLLLLPSSRYVTSQLSPKPTFSGRETLLFLIFFVFACAAS